METLYRKHRRTEIAELREVTEKDINVFNNHGFIHISEYPFGYNISISDADKNNGSPKIGDMIARNPKDYADQWLVAEQYYKDNFALMDNDTTAQLKADKAELLEILNETFLHITPLARFLKEPYQTGLKSRAKSIESLIQKHKQ